MAVTTAALGTGLGAAAAAATGWLLSAALLVLAFEVLDCVDGEVARLRGAASPLGGFLDTLVDKVVEVALILAAGVYLARAGAAPAAQFAIEALLAAVLVLSFTAERFGTVFGRAYPKYRIEPIFSWITAGGEARFVWLSAGLLVTAMTGPTVLLGWLVALAVIAWANAAGRVIQILRRPP